MLNFIIINNNNNECSLIGWNFSIRLLRNLETSYLQSSNEVKALDVKRWHAYNYYSKHLQIIELYWNKFLSNINDFLKICVK